MIAVKRVCVGAMIGTGNSSNEAREVEGEKREGEREEVGAFLAYEGGANVRKSYRNPHGTELSPWLPFPPFPSGAARGAD